MEYHWLAIGGATLGIVGTGALSFDLLKTKTTEDSMTQFQHLQNEIDSSSHELTVRMHDGLSTVTHLISVYLSSVELDEQVAQKVRHGEKLTEDELKTEELSRKARSLLIGQFTEARKHLASKEVVETALTLITEGRSRLEQQFASEVARAQRLRWIAIIGVGLVGVGAIAQLVDLLIPIAP